MPSPFPGMDPYLEAHWGDVHARLVTYACDQLQPRLPNDLRARMQERLVVAPAGAEVRDMVPDVRVVERRGRPRGGTALAEVRPVSAPWVVALPVDAIETYIEIVEAKTRERVVTVIEVLSESNKRGGPDRQKYFRKRRDLAGAGISLVEVDLLRAGPRKIGDRRLILPLSQCTAYAACVHRGGVGPSFEFYRAPLREVLPVISIPLRETDVDVPLDLQAIVDQCYLNGGYDDLDYSVPPDPPLRDDAAWAVALLREKAMR